ncbi:MAG: hypothetical protein M3405_08205 [Acidobacteriota bacterium]|jgi:hypothetical protein|nr:hypothetical protein [Acidobacteriota bacterium]
MKIIKLLLLLLAIGVGAYVIFWLFGVIIGLLWYAVIIGIIAIAGTVGYKLLLSGGDEEKPKLQEKKPTAISELENADRTLEEYKRKYLE